MSISTELTVWCDAKGCPEWLHVEPIRKRAARREAKGNGWRRRRTEDATLVDLCPCHAGTCKRLGAHSCHATDQWEPATD